MYLMRHGKYMNKKSKEKKLCIFVIIFMTMDGCKDICLDYNPMVNNKPGHKS